MLKIYAGPKSFVVEDFLNCFLRSVTLEVCECVGTVRRKSGVCYGNGWLIFQNIDVKLHASL